MQYFVGNLVEGEVAEYYKTVTAELSEKFAINDLSEHIAPHFTFKAPFETSSISEFEQQVESVAIETAKTNITVNGFERFSGRQETIFLSAIEEHTLMETINKIISNLDEYGENKKSLPSPFLLHMSIARFLTHEQSEKIWDYLHALPLPHFILNFDNLTIFKLVGETWEIHKIYRFK